MSIAVEEVANVAVRLAVMLKVLGKKKSMRKSKSLMRKRRLSPRLGQSLMALQQLRVIRLKSS